MVLVIIGLLIAAVLVGRDLIRAAKVNSTVSQYNKLVAAVNTFDMKYGDYPGDINNTKVNQFALHMPGAQCSTGFQDGCENPVAPWIGNRIIDKGTREYGNFYQHLSRAGLVAGYYYLSGFEATGYTDQSASFMEDEMKNGVVLPYECSGPLTRCFVYGLNFNPLSGPITGGGAFPELKNHFDTDEAYGLDFKLDDGNPGAGTMRASRRFVWRDILSGTDIPVSMSEFCCVNPTDVNDYCGATTDYNLANTDANRCTIVARW